LDAERERACIAAAGLLWAALSLALVGRLKVRRRWRTGDTRKLFHLLIFTGAALVQRRAGFGGTLAYGVAVSAVVAVAVVRGTGAPGFEALARESDAPHRTWYVVVPWFATALGGVLANVLFPQHATFGYLVVGLADAVGEPIGIRFGRHRYRVPLPAKVVSTRSVEGSAAVFVASGLAGAAALALAGVPLEAAAIGRLSLFAAACTLVEAAAPHGWDNLLLQLAASAAAMGLFPGVARHG
jgi:phytol kinase